MYRVRVIATYKCFENNILKYADDKKSVGVLFVNVDRYRMHYKKMDLCYVYREMTHQRKAYNHTASGYAFIAKLTPDYLGKS